MIVLKESNYSYLDQNYRSNRNLAVFFLIISIPALMFGFYLYPMLNLFLFPLLLGLSLKYWKESRSYKSGINGEKEVSKTLSQLDDSYHLINDIMLGGDGGGNIDHILICPKGVFLIETKNYTGSIRCYYDKWTRRGPRRFYPIPSPTRQAKHNAERLYTIINRGTNLRTWVSPVVVFTNRGINLRLGRTSMPVLELDQIVEFFEGAITRCSLSEKQIQAISQCILGEHKETMS
ncbi:MAG: NERD domain-containing protein [Chloroflexi bacterium]|nr:NERD domain-containing protein [Chloroflexota bacterium]